MTFSVKKSLLALPLFTLLSLHAAPGQGVPVVRVEKVIPVSSSDSKVYVGKVHGDETVTVVARISGTLEKVAFAEGSMVKKGDLLFKIEDVIYKENLNAAQAALDQADAELVFAKKEKERNEKLFKTEAVSETIYDASVRTYELCKARKAEALARVALMKNDLGYTSIHAPVDGKIGRNVFSEGNYITPAKGELATIVKYDPAKVTFAMSEADFLRFSTQGKLSASGISIKRADGSEHHYSVKVNFTDNMVDSSTGTIMVELLVSNPDMSLLPGGFVTVSFKEVFDPALPGVSVAAVMTDGKSQFVYVVSNGGIAEKREVITGRISGDLRLITSGLQIGETVVTGGMHKVRAGSAVKAVEK